MGTTYPYEKLGLLYLGRELPLPGGASAAQPLLFKNKDMTTHGLIIGMTGSGKTGLAIALIEEAIMDNIPALVIDPKGDMGNLLLTFPNCAPQDFAPWIDPAEAARKEMTLAQYAASTAETWKDGLQSWDQDVQRISALRAKTDMTIYTPGSSAGVPVSVLSSFTAPGQELVNDTDTLNSLVNSTTTSLLGLVDISGDPLQSREHILISSLLLHFWRAGQDLSMEGLIGTIVNPPFAKVGVFSLDTFYPQRERMTLAMRLNNIIASPTFSAWTTGSPLDIQKILYTAEGKPRTAIFSIAHLSETERMFFVTMLLNRFIAWMRQQQGSSSLKALLYMDEIYGYFPPVANPPSKKPMLLMLKQARAYGIGVVLATQNPVDLDYKGLSNIGSWFVGRLPTSQDQDRVVDGIVAASDGKLQTGQVKNLLATLQGRQFLLHSVHLDEPLLFETRWVMSYLKGPMSNSDIKKLMADKKQSGGSADIPAESPIAARTQTGSRPVERVSGAGAAPMLQQGIEQLYSLQNVLSEKFHFAPWLAGEASVRFFNAKRALDVVQKVNLRQYLDETFVRSDWGAAEDGRYALAECTPNPPAGSLYYSLPGCISQLKDFRELGKGLSEYLYQNKRLELFRVKDADFEFESKPDENMRDYTVRLSDYLRQQKDTAVDTLRKRYQLEQDRLAAKLKIALDKLAREKVDVQTKTSDSLISFGAAVIGAFFGRKAFSAGNISKAATGMRNVGRVAKEKNDVRLVEQDIVDLQHALDELAGEIEEQVHALADTFTMENYTIETFAIKPRHSDIFAVRMVLLWEMLA